MVNTAAAQKVGDKVASSITAANQTINNVSNKVNNALNLISESTTMMKIVMLVITIMVIIVIYKMISSYLQYRLENPIYFKKNHIAQRGKTMADNLILRSPDAIEYTHHMHVYVNDWNYNILWFKPILVKTQNNREYSIFVYLNPIRNDLSISITCERNKNNYTLIPNFPLKRWVHLAIVVREISYEVYINGLIVKTVTLSAPAKLNNGNLLICPWGGYGGYFKNVGYANRALSAKEIYDLSRPSIINLGEIFGFGIKIDNILVCLAKYEKPRESDFDNVPTESMGVFASQYDAISKLKYLDDKLFKSLFRQMMKTSSIDSAALISKCPTMEEAPMCPTGTLACSTNQKYCYYPDRDIMVSTYFLPEYDYCPNDKRGKTNGTLPFQIGGINVWEKGGKGKDTKTCPNIK
jgi:hypothetical protein